MVWKPNLHPKYPKGAPGGKGGQFMPVGSPHWSAAVAAQTKAHQASLAKKAATPAAPKPAPAKVAKKAAVKATAVPKVPAKKAAKAAVPAAPKPPRAPAAKKATKAAAPSGPTGSTDAQLIARAKRVEKVVGNGTDSTSLHMTSSGRWSTSRSNLHRQIVSEIWAAQNGDQVPTGRQAVMTGGPTGAGKSTALGLHHAPGSYLLLDPDLAKEALARHGGIPDVPGHPDLSPMERSTLVHQESMHIIEMLAQKAFASGTDVVFDGTMGNVTVTKNRITDLRQQGYKVSGLFVDAPLSITRARVASRYRQGQRDYERGVGQGGRHVPDWVLQGTTLAGGNFGSLTRGRAFSSWESYDNSGAAPRLTGQG